MRANYQFSHFLVIIFEIRTLELARLHTFRFFDFSTKKSINASQLTIFALSRCDFRNQEHRISQITFFQIFRFFDQKIDNCEPIIDFHTFLLCSLKSGAAKTPEYKFSEQSERKKCGRKKKFVLLVKRKKTIQVNSQLWQRVQETIVFQNGHQTAFAFFAN